MLTPTKRKLRDCDDVEKVQKKLKFNSNINSGAPLATPTSVPSTPPSSSNSSAPRPYDQISNRYDSYNHHRNRTTPYSRSDNRSENRR